MGAPADDFALFWCAHCAICIALARFYSFSLSSVLLKYGIDVDAKEPVPVEAPSALSENHSDYEIAGLVAQLDLVI